MDHKIIPEDERHEPKAHAASHAAGGVDAITLSSLGAGTAAALNTGTAQGEIPILGAGGELPGSVMPSSILYFKGTFVNLAALQAAHPTAIAGSYAYVDAGAGNEVQQYNWDADDNSWYLQASASTAETPSSVKTKYESNANTNAFTDAEKSLVGSFVDPILDKSSPGPLGAITPSTINATTGTFSGSITYSGPTNAGFSVLDGTTSGIVWASALGGMAVGTTSDTSLFFGVNNDFGRFVLDTAGNATFSDPITNSGGQIWKNTVGTQMGSLDNGGTATFNGLIAPVIECKSSGFANLQSYVTDAPVDLKYSRIIHNSAGTITWSRVNDAYTAGTDFLTWDTSNNATFAGTITNKGGHTWQNTVGTQIASLDNAGTFIVAGNIQNTADQNTFAFIANRFSAGFGSAAINTGGAYGLIMQVNGSNAIGYDGSGDFIAYSNATIAGSITAANAIFTSMPTSAGAAGTLWNDAGTVKIS